jgi:hypothetical protein
MTATAETCANCGRAIGSNATAAVWRESIVCPQCRDLLELADANKLNGSAPQRRPRIPRWLFTHIIALVAGAGLAWGWFGPHRGAESANPGFKVERVDGDYIDGHPAWYTWAVLNVGSPHILVYQVILNGEYAARAWSLTGVGPPPYDLSIGASQSFVESTDGDNTSYDKIVLFVDVYTSVGNFRYQDGAGFRGLTPSEEAELSTNEAAYKNEHAKELAKIDGVLNPNRALIDSIKPSPPAN